MQTYLNSVRETSETDPHALEATSKLLARSLTLKVKDECFERPSVEQEQCLTQNSEALVMNDGHESMVSALTSGPGSDLAQQLSYSPTAGAGYYSAYVGAVIDMAKLLEGLRTAEYQYIPALTFPKGDALELKLNNPPSFHNPKSVIVVALPAVETAQLPPLHAIDAKEVSCLQGPGVVLPVEGAPLVYSTSLAHSLALHVEGKSGKSIDLPVRAVAAKGGLVVDASAVSDAKLDPHVVGKIVGMWGFDRLDGPSFNLNVPHPTTWRLDKADANSLVVGRDPSPILNGIWASTNRWGSTRQAPALVFVRSPSHFRGSYAPIAARIFLADTPGPTGVNMRRIPFTKVTRPLLSAGSGERLSGCRRGALSAAAWLCGIP